GQTLVFTTYKPTPLGTRRYRPNALKSTISVVLWDIATRRTRHVFYDAQDSASSSDGKLIVVPRRKQIEMWDVATARFLGNLHIERAVPMGEFRFSPDGTILTSASSHGGGGLYLPLDAIAAWDVGTRQLVALHSQFNVNSNGKRFH